MIRDAEHTPYPQSVVVPGWPAGMTRGAVDDVRSGRGLPPIAPAPSSLAGGEDWKNDVEWLRECSRYFLKRDTKGEDSAFWSNIRNSENAARIADRLAALSPEAPAREGVEALRTALIKARSELAIQYCYSAGRMGIAGCYPELAEKYGGSAIVQEIDAVLALTPRHEAPADPCASHRSMGFHIDPCCPHCEAPAEGAGEVREAIVTAIAFLNRDQGTDRLNDTIAAIMPMLVRADAILRGAV